MTANDGVKKLLKIRTELTDFTDKMFDAFCTPELVYELMAMRSYTSVEMFNTLYEVGVFKVSSLTEVRLAVPTVTDEQLKEWGLLTEKGDFLLRNRYVVAIRDITGKVAALVGWYPDLRKYITSPTFGFSKDSLFFNMDAYKDSIDNHNGVVYVVEGIFDTLALRSIGLPAYGVMGLELSPYKVQMLNRHTHVVAIPDGDKAGRSPSPFTNAISGKSTKFKWNIEGSHVFVKFPYTEEYLGTICEKEIKDCDDLIKYALPYYKDSLLSCANARLLKRLKRNREVVLV